MYNEGRREEGENYEKTKPSTKIEMSEAVR